MPGCLQVIADQVVGNPMERDVARFLALSRHLQMCDTAPLVLEILHPELAKLFPP
jgi:hypothetical protein